MRARPSIWLVTVLSTAALLAGCGGSSKSSSGTSGASTAGAASTPSTSPAGVAPGSGAAGEAAIAACKQAIQAQTTLPATAKAKLEAVCGKAASGDQAAVRTAAKEVCEEVIQKSAIPSSAKERALQTCRK
jgi:hypothetical protein